MTTQARKAREAVEPVPVIDFTGAVNEEAKSDYELLRPFREERLSLDQFKRLWEGV